MKGFKDTSGKFRPTGKSSGLKSNQILDDNKSGRKKIEKINGHKVRIYDNGGRTIDRYTVIIGRDAYGMSTDPFYPQGFNMHVGEVPNQVMLGGHLGKRVNFNSLPTEVKKAIMDRMI